MQGSFPSRPASRRSSQERRACAVNRRSSQLQAQYPDPESLSPCASCLCQTRRCITLLPAQGPYENLQSSSCACCILGSASLAFAEGKPKLTLDEFFNSVSYPAVAISPDGNSVVIVTERADWDQQDLPHRPLALSRRRQRRIAEPLSSNSPNPVTTPSPSGRPTAAGSRSSPSARLPPKKIPTPTTTKTATKEVSQIYLISPAGGEAIPADAG